MPTSGANFVPNTIAFLREGGRGFRRRFAQQFQDEWKPRATPTFHLPSAAKPAAIGSPIQPPGQFSRSTGECRQAMAEAAAESRTVVPLPGWLSTDIVPR